MKDRDVILQPNTEIVISSIDDAMRLLHCARPLWIGSRRRVVVNINSISPIQQRRWGARLSTWLNACGCHTGALFAVIAISGCIIMLSHKPTFEWLDIPGCFAVVVAVSLVGKIMGLAIARLMLVLDLKRLIRQTSSNTYTNHPN